MSGSLHSRPTKIENSVILVKNKECKQLQRVKMLNLL